MWKPKIGDHVRHKYTDKKMIIVDFWGGGIVATCKLKEPYYIKNPTKMLIDTNVCYVENLILDK